MEIYFPPPADSYWDQGQRNFHQCSVSLTTGDHVNKDKIKAVHPSGAETKQSSFCFVIDAKNRTQILCNVVLLFIQSSGPEISFRRMIGTNSLNSAFLGHVAFAPEKWDLANLNKSLYRSWSFGYRIG